MSDRPAGSWFALNGWGVLIGLLEITIAVFYFVEPTRTTLAGHAIYGTIGLAGIGLIYSYARQRVDLEVYASILLAVSNLANFAFTAVTDDPPAFEVRAAVIQLIVVFAVVLRVSALWKGGVYAIPRWRDPKGTR